MRLDKFEFAVLYHKQDGLCGCGCGQLLEHKQVDEEHTIPNYFKPGKPDSLWRRECHRAKTSKDAATIAKCRRLRGEKGQQARRAKKGSQIKNRGFTQKYKKKFDGTVKERTE